MGLPTSGRGDSTMSRPQARRESLVARQEAWVVHMTTLARAGELLGGGEMADFIHDAIIDHFESMDTEPPFVLGEVTAELEG